MISYAGFAASLPLLTCFGLFEQQTPPNPPPAAQSADPLAELRALAARAAAMLADGQPGYGEFIRAAAAQLNRAGSRDEAMRLLRSLAAKPETPFDLAEAHRMLGQYTLTDGFKSTITESTNHFLKQIEVFDAHPEMKTSFAMLYASGVTQAAANLRASGFLEDAAKLHARILGPDRALFDAGVITSTLLNQAAVLEKSGDPAGAVAAIDDLLASYPDYGTNDGARLRLLVRRLTLLFPDKSSPQHLDALRSLWNDPSSRRTAWCLDLGMTLSDSLRTAARVPEAIDVELACLDALEANRPAWTASTLEDRPGSRHPRELQNLEITFLSKLQSADNFMRPDACIRALRRLCQLARDAQERASFSLHLQRLGQPPCGQ